jgi:hypothetical protein
VAVPIYHCLFFAMSGNNSDDSTGPALPRGVLKARAGWKGDDMEMEHQMRETDKSGTSVAVDLQQFRNEEVGVGYQAKHVVRQRSGQTPEQKIHDMSKASNEDSQSKKKKKRKHEEKPEAKEDPAERVRKYLQSEGLRRFRKELEKIV